MLTGWKTLIVAALVALVGVAQQADWVTLVGSKDSGYVIAGIGVLMAVLRLITSTPAGPLK